MLLLLKVKHEADGTLKDNKGRLPYECIPESKHLVINARNCLETGTLYNISLHTSLS